MGRPLTSLPRGASTDLPAMWHLQVGAVGIQVVSLIWFWKILQVAFHKAKKLGPETKQE